MLKRVNYLYHKAISAFWCAIRKVVGLRHFKRSHYCKQKVLDIDEANDLLYEHIISGKPFLAARFGDAELRALVYSLENKMRLRKGFPKYIRKVMHLNAGFFPVDDASLMRFGDVLWQSAKQVDVFGVWFNLMEDYVIKKSAPNATVVELEALEPYRSVRPWSRALKGKKVLIVHPFEQSIRKQYEKRKLLFTNQEVLPDFTLITYKAVQSNAGARTGFSSWFDAIKQMEADIDLLEYDIAIVGCGSYGLPLSAHIKQKGKQVIHLAGATQLLFGIRGARWDVRPEMQHFFNEYWTRPDLSERPKDASRVEGACYW